MKLSEADRRCKETDGRPSFRDNIFRRRCETMTCHHNLKWAAGPRYGQYVKRRARAKAIARCNKQCKFLMKCFKNRRLLNIIGRVMPKSLRLTRHVSKEMPGGREMARK